MRIVSRRSKLSLGAALLVVALTWIAVPRFVESRLRARLGAEAARRGVTLAVRKLVFSWIGPLVLEGVDARKGSAHASVERLAVGWRPVGFRPLGWVRSVRIGRGVFERGDLRAEIPDAAFRVRALSSRGGELVREPSGDRLGFEVGAKGLDVRFSRLDLRTLVRLTRKGRMLVDPGRVSGRAAVVALGGEISRLDVVALAEGLRLIAVEGDGRFGEPVSLEIAVAADLGPGSRAEVSCLRLLTGGVELFGSGTAALGENDLLFDVRADVKRVELASILKASGLDLSLGDANDLGWASLTLEASGQLRDPASIRVEDHLVFQPPQQKVAALEALKGPFVHTVAMPDGTSSKIDVAEGAPGFVALDAVPPLFLRALTISEDAGFWGHKGIDLKEIPVAYATNLARGTKARGASTISQQLAKNLFLSRQKSYGRKLQEGALTLLLESTLSKRRILEIYLNVIEWGPGLHGLRPAARRYFGKEPAELTTKEMVFLVCLIPGPTLYQQSFEKGAVTPRFHVLLVNLLAKLQSVDAISEEEYAAAVAEDLRFTTTRIPSTSPGNGPDATIPVEETPDDD